MNYEEAKILCENASLKSSIASLILKNILKNTETMNF